MRKKSVEPMPQTTSGRILKFVREHPETSTPEMHVVFGLPLDHLCNILKRLRADSLVTSEKIPGKAAHLWTAVEVPLEVLEANDEARRAANRENVIRRAHLPIKRKFVKEWTCTTPRGEFENHFFGPAK